MGRALRLGLNKKAFLLIEASLSAVVIAVGLIFISRGISNSLYSLSRIRETDAAIRVAESALIQQEMYLQVAGKLSLNEPSFKSDLEGFGVKESDEKISLSDYGFGDESFRAVELAMREEKRESSLLRLWVVWPDEWFLEQ
jgi:hypothetical protein